MAAIKVEIENNSGGLCAESIELFRHLISDVEKNRSKFEEKCNSIGEACRNGGVAEASRQLTAALGHVVPERSRILQYIVSELSEVIPARWGEHDIKPLMAFLDALDASIVALPQAYIEGSLRGYQAAFHLFGLGPAAFQQGLTPGIRLALTQMWPMASIQHHYGSHPSPGNCRSLIRDLGYDIGHPARNRMAALVHNWCIVGEGDSPETYNGPIMRMLNDGFSAESICERHGIEDSPARDWIFHVARSTNPGHPVSDWHPRALRLLPSDTEWLNVSRATGPSASAAI